MLEDEFLRDIRHVSLIPEVINLLDVVCKATGMRFAAIARVTSSRWITCSVVDNLAFGLIPGSELEIKTTICDEIRDSSKAIIIDCVDTDPLYRDHHTPKLYGFQSYISVPIFRKDGRFFGTLCAIDPLPKKLNNPAITGLFELFTALISYHLHEIEQSELKELQQKQAPKFSEMPDAAAMAYLQDLEAQNQALENLNAELKAFSYISSHDLQVLLRKIRVFAFRITEQEAPNLSEYGKDLFGRIQKSVQRMQSLIQDLLDYTDPMVANTAMEYAHLNTLLAEVGEELKEELQRKNATIEISSLGECPVVAYQIRQLFYNLIRNSIKFSSPNRPLQIRITCQTGKDSSLLPKNKKAADYCHLRFEDNGLGFEPAVLEKMFDLGQRLQGKSESIGAGLGMAMVKKIVQNHGGEIAVSSQLNEGACFEIYLPLKKRD